MPSAQDPTRDRREPPITHPSRLALAPLAESLRKAVERHVAPRGGKLTVLDVGCGPKPYAPYLAPYASEHVGLDMAPGPGVDVVASSDALPFPDERFDVVLCSQMLEHVLEPAATIAEINRVLKPGGVLLLSTHGTAVYHPCPTDLWRWTQEGLEKIVRDNGSWSRFEIAGAGGTVACFGYLLAFYVSNLLSPRPLAPVRAAAVALINAVFGALDRVVPLHHPRKYTLIANFVVVAVRGERDGGTM